MSDLTRYGPSKLSQGQLSLVKLIDADNVEEIAKAAAIYRFIDDNVIDTKYIGQLQSQYNSIGPKISTIWTDKNGTEVEILGNFIHWRDYNHDVGCHEFVRVSAWWSMGIDDFLERFQLTNKSVNSSGEQGHAIVVGNTVDAWLKTEIEISRNNNTGLIKEKTTILKRYAELVSVNYGTTVLQNIGETKINAKAIYGRFGLSLAEAMEFINYTGMLMGILWAYGEDDKIRKMSMGLIQVEIDRVKNQGFKLNDSGGSEIKIYTEEELRALSK